MRIRLFIETLVLSWILFVFPVYGNDSISLVGGDFNIPAGWRRVESDRKLEIQKESEINGLSICMVNEYDLDEAEGFESFKDDYIEVQVTNDDNVFIDTNTKMCHGIEVTEIITVQKEQFGDGFPLIYVTYLFENKNIAKCAIVLCGLTGNDFLPDIWESIDAVCKQIGTDQFSTDEDDTDISSISGGSEYNTDLMSEDKLNHSDEGIVYVVDADSDEFEITDVFYDQYDSYGTFTYDAIVTVKNKCDYPLYLSSCSFDLEDMEGHLIGTDSEFSVAACPNIVNPGEVGYFYNYLGSNIDGSVDEKYRLVIHPTIIKSTEKSVDYEVSDVSFHKSSGGEIQITGRVTNTTNTEDGYLYVNAVLFRNNEVVGVTGVNLTDLAPGKPKSFSISDVLLGRAAREADSVKIYAQKVSYQFNW